MRAVIQRVSEASVTVGDRVTGRIGHGLAVLLCAMHDDGPEQARALAERIARLRIFRDAEDKMNLSILQTGGQALVISQFTLAADTSRGNRPGFSAAADPGTGEALYEAFITALAATGVPVESGEFGADMKVALVNDGPVTIWMDR